MPELPEVETVRRQLEPELVGKRITSASVLDERLTRPEPPQSLERAVAGREVTAVARRGKYLLIGLEGGRTLALHLRMTGNLLLRDSDHGET
ncbi:MAG: DNA-formamidopyrimidine glycosylase family protein, partial [Solirubrobacterales bacterium]